MVCGQKDLRADVAAERLYEIFEQYTEDNVSRSYLATPVNGIYRIRSWDEHRVTRIVPEIPALFVTPESS